MMSTNCVVTYKKKNGELVMRPYGLTFKNVGDITSMGWEVVDIHYYYEGNYYCLQDFTMVYRKGKQALDKPKLKKRIVKKIIKLIEKHA